MTEKDIHQIRRRVDRLRFNLAPGTGQTVQAYRDLYERDCSNLLRHLDDLNDHTLKELVHALELLDDALRKDAVLRSAAHNNPQARDALRGVRPTLATVTGLAAPLWFDLLLPARHIDHLRGREKGNPKWVPLPHMDAWTAARRTEYGLASRFAIALLTVFPVGCYALYLTRELWAVAASVAALLVGAFLPGGSRLIVRYLWANGGVHWLLAPFVAFPIFAFLTGSNPETFAQLIRFGVLLLVVLACIIRWELLLNPEA